MALVPVISGTINNTPTINRGSPKMVMGVFQ